MTNRSPDPEPVTYALIHGGGDVGWAWHLVEAELRALGCRTVAIDLPVDGDAGLAEQAAAVVDAVGDANRVVVVAHSFGGFTGPLVAATLPGAVLLVLVAAMVPRPGEAPGDWWSETGFDTWPGTGDPADERETFYQDVEPALAEEAASRARDDRTRGLGEPWPLEAWPDVATRYVLFRQDRFFPAPFVRSMVQDRLGIEPDELDGSHCGMLSRPVELAAYLDRAAKDGRSAPRNARDRRARPD